MPDQLPRLLVVPGFAEGNDQAESLAVRVRSYTEAGTISMPSGLRHVTLDRYTDRAAQLAAEEWHSRLKGASRNVAALLVANMVNDPIGHEGTGDPQWQGAVGDPIVELMAYMKERGQDVIMWRRNELRGATADQLPAAMRRRYDAVRNLAPLNANGNYGTLVSRLNEIARRQGR